MMGGEGDGDDGGRAEVMCCREVGWMDGVGRMDGWMWMEGDKCVLHFSARRSLLWCYPSLVRKTPILSNDSA